MLCHRANHVSPTIVGNCLSCEKRTGRACILVDVCFDSYNWKMYLSLLKEFLEFVFLNMF